MRPTHAANMKIGSTMLGLEDHGIFSFFLHLEGDGVGQGFGGWPLDDKPLEGGSERRGAEHSIPLLARILTVVGVEKWEDLRGKTVRVSRETPYGAINGLGNIIKDDWVFPKWFYVEYEAAQAAVSR